MPNFAAERFEVACLNFAFCQYNVVNKNKQRWESAFLN